MRSSSPSAQDASGHLQGLARRIRMLRERRGLTQEDFAARCGISVSFASLLERGERSPSYETLVQVAGALGVPLAELFRAEDDEAAGAHRLVEFARARHLTRTEVDRLLAVAEAMFTERAPGELPAED
ncbi:MAG TPA: helix-turn-helix transcriptional regulator, partial [Myxococcaceae bacterium]|nr:helix-turn-helix transcriptional regulator [Myxococcaceae bacterium]